MQYETYILSLRVKQMKDFKLTGLAAREQKLVNLALLFLRESQWRLGAVSLDSPKCREMKSSRYEKKSIS